MPEVTVAIPTFRRPRSLERLLLALEKIQTTASVTVLVADNDAVKHEGADKCAAIRALGYRWPLGSRVVAARGIAQVRNALVEVALGDERMEHLAMIDDDEWPQPQWLSALLAEQAKTGAGVLQGSILFEFDKPPQDWASAFDGMSDVRHPSGP